MAITRKPIGLGMTQSKTALGIFIRESRLARKLSQAALSKRTGIDQSTISRLEIGTAKYLACWQANLLAEALECEECVLRGLSLEKNPIVPRTALGKKIERRRRALGLGIEQLAQRLKMDPACVRRFIGRSKPTISLKMTGPLATALELEPKEFLRFVYSGQRRPATPLGKIIRARRLELGLNIAALASRLKVSRQYAHLLELHGCSLSQSDELLKRLASVLRIEPSSLKSFQQRRRIKQCRSRDPVGGFFGRRRVKQGWTQRKLEQLAGLKCGQVAAFESGKQRLPIPQQRKIAATLHCRLPARSARRAE